MCWQFQTAPRETVCLGSTLFASPSASFGCITMGKSLLVRILECFIAVTVMIRSFRTDRSGQTVQTQIRLLSDQGLHCLLFHLHHFDKIPKNVWPLCLTKILVSENLGTLRYWVSKYVCLLSYLSKLKEWSLIIPEVVNVKHSLRVW